MLYFSSREAAGAAASSTRLRILKLIILKANDSSPRNYHGHNLELYLFQLPPSFADQGYKNAIAQRARAHTPGHALDEPQFLPLLSSYRDNHLTPHDHLSQQLRRYIGRGCCDQDTIIRRMLRPTQ